MEAQKYFGYFKKEVEDREKLKQKYLDAKRALDAKRDAEFAKADLMDFAEYKPGTIVTYKLDHKRYKIADVYLDRTGLLTPCVVYRLAGIRGGAGPYWMVHAYCLIPDNESDYTDTTAAKEAFDKTYEKELDALHEASKAMDDANRAVWAKLRKAQQMYKRGSKFKVGQKVRIADRKAMYTVGEVKVLGFIDELPHVWYHLKNSAGNWVTSYSRRVNFEEANMEAV